MVVSVNAWRFRRGLDDKFLDALEVEAKRGGWFADVLADRDLLLGIRKNYLNVYRYGQSLFMVEWKGRGAENRKMSVSTHPKYLLDPDLKNAVEFDGTQFHVGGIGALLREYGGREALNRMKRAAELYAGDEKCGVQTIVRRNPNVVDVEIAFGGAPSAPRMDIALFEKVDGKIHIRGWEVKHFSNPELPHPS